MKALRKITSFSLLSTILVLAACGEGTTTMEPATMDSGPSFAAQADAGAATYATSCGACHGAELQGTALGPMLSGGGFLGSYGRQSPYEFFNFLKANMPPGGNAGISDDDYWAIVAHVVRINGVANNNPALDDTAGYAMATNIPGVNPTLTQQRVEPD